MLEGDTTAGKKWNAHALTESEFIEYSQCIEKLEGLGLRRQVVEVMAMKCHNCILEWRCDVNSNNRFPESKTCQAQR